jgi:hypothetical protein
MPNETSGPNGPHPKVVEREEEESLPVEHLVIGNSHVIVEDDSD